MALNQTSDPRMVTGLFPDRDSAERAYGDISTRDTATRTSTS